MMYIYNNMIQVMPLIINSVIQGRTLRARALLIYAYVRQANADIRIRILLHLNVQPISDRGAYFKQSFTGPGQRVLPYFKFDLYEFHI